MIEGFNFYYEHNQIYSLSQTDFWFGVDFLTDNAKGLDLGSI
jgi:hypothetical protein